MRAKRSRRFLALMASLSLFALLAASPSASHPANPRSLQQQPEIALNGAPRANTAQQLVGPAQLTGWATKSVVSPLAVTQTPEIQTSQIPDLDLLVARQLIDYDAQHEFLQLTSLNTDSDVVGLESRPSQRLNTGSDLTPATRAYSMFSSGGIDEQPNAIVRGASDPQTTFQPATGGWWNRPPGATGATRACPGSDQWLLLYWGGQAASILEAYGSCPNSLYFWVRQGPKWLGFVAATIPRPGVNDEFTVQSGEAAFIRGVSAP
jgi:hypothetical protein